MKIVADENVDFSLVAFLRKNNFEIIHIGDVLSGADDEQVLSFANNEKAILLTEDKDFGELVYRLRKANSGVILVRLSGIDSTAKANFLCDKMKQHFDKMKNAFTVISINKIRIKTLK